MFGAKVRYAKEVNFKASVTSILNCVNKKTKFVFLANPNKPTGTYLEKSEIIKLRKNYFGSQKILFRQKKQNLILMSFQNY